MGHVCAVALKGRVQPHVGLWPQCTYTGVRMGMKEVAVSGCLRKELHHSLKGSQTQWLHYSDYSGLYYPGSTICVLPLFFWLDQQNRGLNAEMLPQKS